MPNTKAKTTKRANTKKTAVKEVPAEPEPVPQPEPEPETQVEDTTEEETVEMKVKGLIAGVGKVKEALMRIVAELREVSKMHTRQVKDLSKKAKKKRKRRTPVEGEEPRLTGFAKPQEVSKELKDFMGKSENELVSRTEASSFINAYVKEHKLSNSEDGRLFEPDSKLHKLLGDPLPLKKADPSKTGYGYFNLQTYLTPHFPKKKTVTA